MTKTKLTKVYVNDRDKEGNPFVTKKTGKPYKKIAIMTEAKPEVWLSDFINKPDDSRLAWKVGDEVEIKIEQNGQWWNFSLPDNFDYLKEKVYQLQDRVVAIERFISKDQLPVVERIEDVGHEESEDFPF